MPIEISLATSYVLAIAVFALSVTVYKTIAHERPQFTRFESLTLKMQAKDVDDFDENWQINLPYQPLLFICRN